MKIKKRGQITAFIIIGLVILLAIFIIVYSRRESIMKRELINPEMVPIQDYVDSCTEDLAREALEIIGLTGGYIYFPKRVKNNPRSYLSLSPVKELGNPYWWYYGRSAIPSLEFIESQISRYVKENLAKCINNFSAFYNKYNVIELGGYDVVTKIGEDDVMVTTIYPIEVQNKFNKTIAKLQRYIVRIPIRLKKVYTLAREIMESENRDYFIERKTIDLISMDRDIPTTGTEIGCGKKRWLVSDVENKIRRLLEINLPFIKIRGTKFSRDEIIPFSPDPNPYSVVDRYNESYYNYHYIWDIGDNVDNNMRVSFGYDKNWDMDFYVRPKRGQVLESNAQRGAQLLSLLCLRIWHFTYDIIFPVKVTIVDEKTENNERYSFSFAFMASINHNQADRSNFAIDIFETKDEYTSEEFCRDVTNEITIHAIEDVPGGIDIRGVNISFTCGKFVCPMGLTESDFESGGLPVLRKKFPYCVNGVLRGKKKGYEEAEMFIQTDRPRSYYLKMTPVRYLNVSVVKHKIVGDSVGMAKRLDSNEKAVISIKNNEKKFEVNSVYPVEESIRLLDKDNFDYDVEIYLSDNGTTEGGYRIKGGYKGKWTVSYNALRLANNVTFHLVEGDFKSDEEKYLFFATLDKYSKKIPFPELK